MGVRLLPKGIEEGAFKPVSEGWLFQASNPWILGPGRTYLVTEAQKPAVAARVRASRYATVVAAVVEAWLIMAAVAKYPWLLSPTSEAIGAWAGSVVAICALFALSDWLIMRRVVQDLPRTSQKAAMLDRWRNLGASLSTTAIAVFLALCALFVVTSLYVALTEARTSAWMGGAFFAVLGVVYGTMLIAKLRAKPDVTAD